MRFFLIITILLFIKSLGAQTTGTLLLKSSFNNTIVNKDVSWNHHLSGTDSITGFTFPDDLPGDNVEDYFNYVINDLDNYTDYANAEVVTTIGSDETPTKALYIEFIKDDPSHPAYTRVQYAIYGDSLSNDPVQRMNKGYIKYKIKKHFHKDVNGTDWSLPLEWKDMDDDGFRMGLYAYDSNGFSPFWVAKGQYMIDGELGDDIWQYDNYEIAVPEDEWFDLEAYWFAHPDTGRGKLKIAINGEILFDITNQTKDPDHPNKMFYFMPFKLYGNVGHSWITDFEYWSAPPANSVIVGVDDHQDMETFSVFPNPTSNKVYIPSDFLTQDYQISSTTGSIVKRGIIDAQAIDLSTLKPGVYFIKITDGETSNTRVARIIKQ